MGFKTRNGLGVRYGFNTLQDTGSGINQGQLYIDNSTALGYSGGSAICVQEFLNELEGAPTPQGELYVLLSDALGYSGGSATCVQDFLTELENIA